MIRILQLVGLFQLPAEFGKTKAIIASAKDKAVTSQFMSFEKTLLKYFVFCNT